MTSQLSKQSTDIRTNFDNSVKQFFLEGARGKALQSLLRDQEYPEAKQIKRLWKSHIFRMRQVRDKIADEGFQLLCSMQPPQIESWTPSKYERRKLFDCDVIDVMNIDDSSDIDYRCNKNRSSWYNAGKAEVTLIFGKPHKTFTNHDGSFGMWWIKTLPGSPFEDSQIFAICAGPTGMRCGMIKPKDDPKVDVRFRTRTFSNVSKYDELMICWFQQWVWQEVSIRSKKLPKLPEWLMSNRDSSGCYTN